LTGDLGRHSVTGRQLSLIHLCRGLADAGWPLVAIARLLGLRPVAVWRYQARYTFSWVKDDEELYSRLGRDLRWNERIAFYLGVTERGTKWREKYR